jgi:(p)ppGpp synthase/HD superfamily hydrolase
VNIENIEQRDKPNTKKLIDLVIVVANIIQLNNILDKLKGLPHIVSASRH